MKRRVLDLGEWARARRERVGFGFDLEGVLDDIVVGLVLRLSLLSWKMLY